MQLPVCLFFVDFAFELCCASQIFLGPILSHAIRSPPTQTSPEDICICVWAERNAYSTFGTFSQTLSSTCDSTPKQARNLTSDPAEGPKLSVSETPALHWRGRAVRLGGITELTACCGLLLFIHQAEISNFQFPPCRTLKPTPYTTKTPFNNKGQLLWLPKMTNNWSERWIIQSGLLLLVGGLSPYIVLSAWPRVLTNPLPDGVTKVSPTAPLLAGVVHGVTELRGE